MPHQIPFPIENFAGYCTGLRRVGLDLGFIMYTNQHASNHHPAARLLPRVHLQAAQSYADSPSDEGFKYLVTTGVLLDTEWDRRTEHWQVISYEGWEVLHTAFNHLHTKYKQALLELTGVSDLDVTESS
jgi:hypothetical protein